MSYAGTATSGHLWYSTGDSQLHNFNVLVGDVDGAIHQTIVNGIQTVPVSNTPPVSGQYLRYNGSQWLPQSGDTTAASPHNLLSATHSDTTPATVVRGDLIRGVSGSTWSRLGLGTMGWVLYANGVDVDYTQLGDITPFSAGTISAPSMTFASDSDTGWSRPFANIIVGTAGGSGLLRLDGGINAVVVDGGYRLKSVPTSGNYVITAADYVTLVQHILPCSITLPASPSQGEQHIIKDASGVCTTNNITILGNGKNIDGNADVAMRNNYASFTLIYNGNQWNIL